MAKTIKNNKNNKFAIRKTAKKLISGLFCIILLGGGSTLLTACSSEPGPQGPAGASGSTWYSGANYKNIQGVIGDYFYDTDDYKIYKMREEGWSLISTIKPVVTISNAGYWVIDGVSTNVKATGEDGLTPYIKDGNWWIGEQDLQIEARGENGKNAYQLAQDNGFDGTLTEWLDSLKGQNGSTWFSGEQYTSNQGVIGDYFYDTDDYRIFKKGESGWELISTIKPIVTINDSGYWVIDGVVTNKKASGEDGLTPYIKNGNWWIGEQDLQIEACGDDGKTAYQLAQDNGFEGTLSEWLESLKGKDGNTWHSGTELAQSLGNIGDYFYDSDDFKIYNKTQSGWELISTIKPTITINNAGYWVVDGIITGVKATGENGLTPYIKNGNWWVGEQDLLVKATGENGKTAYQLAQDEGFEGTLSEWLDSLKGQNGNTWHSGVEPIDAVGIIGDYFYDTDNFTIYTKTQSGWELISTIKPTITINDNGYWVIDGVETDAKAVGEDGLTPYIKNGTWWVGTQDLQIEARGENGKSAYELAQDEGFEGTLSEWLDSLKGQNGSTWHSGTAPEDTLGVVGDYYFDTDDYTIYNKTQNGWVMISTIKPVITINDAGYWVIDGTITDKIAVAEDGLTPYIKNGTWWIGTQDLEIQARAENGKSAYELAQDEGFEGTLSDWLNNLKGEKGDNGKDGADGNSWHSGEGIPATELGNDGDLYLDQTNYIIYKKVDGNWSIIANFTNIINWSNQEETFDFKNLNYSSSTGIDDYTGKIIKASTSNSRVTMTDLVMVNVGDRIILNDENYKFIIYGYNDAEGTYASNNQFIDTNPEDSTSKLKNWGNDFTFTETTTFGNGKTVTYPLFVRLTVRCNDNGANGTLYPQDFVDAFEYKIKTDNSHLIVEEIKKPLHIAPEFYNANIVSHRGLTTNAPENTISAFKEAFNNGVKIIEADVQFTADGIPVILHDTTIDRTSNGTGNVWDFTLEELKTYDFGSWKNEQYAGETIPTLKEFLVFCKTRNILCELDLASKTFTSTQMKTIYDLVESLGMLDKTIFTATHAELTDYLSYNDQLIVSVSGITSLEVAESVLVNYTDCSLVFASIPVANLTEELVTYVHSLGLKAKVWTINSMSDIETALSYGVDLILSDSLTKLYED